MSSKVDGDSTVLAMTVTMNGKVKRKKDSLKSNNTN